MTMQPNQGISLDIGTKRGASYFLNETGTCKLIVMVAEALVGDDVPTQPATRFEVALEPGKTGRVDTAEGRSLEFTCAPGARSMSLRAIDQIVYERP
jgi:hypothetical protein